MSAGDDACEAYTAIAWGVLLSHEMGLPQGRRPWKGSNATWAMPLCEASFALPGSENTSRAKGTRRNLGDLVSPAIAKAVPGHGGKPRRRSCRGRGEESDGLHSTWEAPNNAVWSAAAEVVEGRRPIGGKARGDACPGHRAGSGMSLKQRAYASELKWVANPRMPMTFDLR